MPIHLKNKGSDFAPLDAGAYQAICYGVIDIGTQDTGNFGPKPKIILLFELPFERLDVPEKGNLPRVISTEQTQSLSEKSNLRKLLKSWRGRDFTDKELEDFDPHALIGVNCQVNVTHTQKGDKTYANISTIMPLAKGMTKRELEQKPIYFSLEDQPDLTNIKFQDNIPQWIQAKVLASEEVNNASGQGAPRDEPVSEDEPSVDDNVPF